MSTRKDVGTMTCCTARSWCLRWVFNCQVDELMMSLSQMFFSLLHSSRCLRCICRFDEFHGDGNWSICMCDGTTWMFHISWCHFLILIFSVIGWHWWLVLFLWCILLDVLQVVLQNIDIDGVILMSSVSLLDGVLRRFHVDAFWDAGIDKALRCLRWQSIQDVESSMMCWIFDRCREVLDALWGWQTRCTVWDVIIPKVSLMPSEFSKDALDEVPLDGENSWWVNLILTQVICMTDDLKMISNLMSAPGIDGAVPDGHCQIPCGWLETDQEWCLWRRCVQPALRDQPWCGCDGLQWTLAQTDVPPGMSKIWWDLDDLLDAKMPFQILWMMFQDARKMLILFLSDVQPDEILAHWSQIGWWLSIWPWCRLLIDVDALRDVQGKMVSHQTQDDQRCHCQKMGDVLGWSPQRCQKSDASPDGCGDAQNDAKRSFKRCSLQTMISCTKIWCKGWCPRTPKRCPKQNRKDVDVDDIHYHVVSCRCATIWCSPLVLLKEVQVREDKEDGYRMFVNHG